MIASGAVRPGSGATNPERLLGGAWKSGPRTLAVATILVQSSAQLVDFPVATFEIRGVNYRIFRRPLREKLFGANAGGRRQMVDDQLSGIFVHRNPEAGS